jgi:hypothetical protein
MTIKEAIKEIKVLRSKMVLNSKEIEKLKELTNFLKNKKND